MCVDRLDWLYITPLPPTFNILPNLPTYIPYRQGCIVLQARNDIRRKECMMMSIGGKKRNLVVCLLSLAASTMMVNAFVPTARYVMTPTYLHTYIHTYIHTHAFSDPLP